MAASVRQQELSNLRRGIDFELRDLPLWCSFNGEKNGGEADGYTKASLRRASDQATQLEDLARESSAVDREDYFEYRCDAISISARVHAMGGRFIEAHRLLDRATSGLGSLPRHNLLRSSVYLIRAETCALSAASHLSSDSLQQVDSSELNSSVTHCRDLLRRASESLDQSEKYLADGRRDLSKWIDLYIGRAQIGLEQLLLETLCYDDADLWGDAWSHQHFAAEVERRLGHSLLSLRAAIDTIPYSMGTKYTSSIAVPQHHQERKALALWVQLLVAGDTVLRLGRLRRAADVILPDDAIGEHARIPRAMYARLLKVSKTLAGNDDLAVYIRFYARMSRSYRFDRFADSLDEGLSENGKEPAVRFIKSLRSLRDKVLPASIADRKPRIRDSLVAEIAENVDCWIEYLWSTRRAGRKKASR